MLEAPKLIDAKARDMLRHYVGTVLPNGFKGPGHRLHLAGRGPRGDELLQAIARVNRTHAGKRCGYVVDYIGVGAHLTEALAVYAEADVDGAMADIRDELPRPEALQYVRDAKILGILLEKVGSGGGGAARGSPAPERAAEPASLTADRIMELARARREVLPR